MIKYSTDCRKKDYYEGIRIRKDYPIQIIKIITDDPNCFQYQKIKDYIC